MNYTPQIVNLGSVSDIQSSRKHGFNLSVAELDKELEYERAHHNRSTVINILEVERRKAKKLEGKS